jgi:adenosine kinase
MGCIGQDEYGKMLIKMSHELGLKTAFEVTNKAPTATCAVLLTKNNRSLVAHLGAAYNFSVEFLEDNWPLLKNIRIFYITVCVLFLKIVQGEYHDKINNKISHLIRVTFL